MGNRRLREFEELLLLTVLIGGPEAYGASLQRILANEADRDVSLGAIYTALERLQRKGLVRSSLGDPTPVRGGRRKRQYELTPAGMEMVKEVRRIRDHLWGRVEGQSAKGEAAG